MFILNMINLIYLKTKFKLENNLGTSCNVEYFFEPILTEVNSSCKV